MKFEAEHIISGEEFDEKFENPQKTKINGTDVEIYDLVPKDVKTDVPTLMQPGWGGTPEMHKGILRELYNSGRRTISTRAPVGIEHDLDADIDSANGVDVADATLRRIAGITESLDRLEVDRADLVGYSEGGLDVIMAARMNPEKVRNICIVNPAGLIGKDSFFRLSTSFVLDSLVGAVKAVRDPKLHDPLFRGMKSLGASFVANPAKSMREIFAMTNAQAQEIMKELRELGIKISIIHSVDDKAFPMDRMQEIVDAGCIDGFYSIGGGHGEYHYLPEKVTIAVDHALSAMEKLDKNL